VLTDIYSVASATFDPGIEVDGDDDDDFVDIVSGVPGGTRTKGVAAWISEQKIVLIIGGKEARYERFVLSNNHRGAVICSREGWSRFLVPN